MNVPVEPACYAWAAEKDADGQYPPPEFIEGILWLEAFFFWNRHCRVPMSQDLRAAVARLFPYTAAARAGRIAQAQELIGVITRMIDRVSAATEFDYQGVEPHPATLPLNRGGSIYLDDDVWLSWCDVLSQCVAESEKRHQELYAFMAWVGGCVELGSSGVSRSGPVIWVQGGRNTLPEGTVDPSAMQAMTARWRKTSRPLVFEDSGHQPPVTIKRLLSRVIDDCEGVILRFGSTYFNPNLSVRCAVVGCGTDGDRVSQLECSASDGMVTLRGIFRTTAQTASEQSAAVSFVRQRLYERCAEAGFNVAS